MIKFVLRTGVILFVLSLSAGWLYAQQDAVTPLQQGIAQSFQQRQAAGQPVPDYTFQGQFSGASNTGDLLNLTAVTEINFAGPHEAGFVQWPLMTVPGEFSSDTQATLTERDITAEFYAAVEQAHPGYLAQFPPGQEPRTLRITERIIQRPVDIMPTATTVTTNEAIVMGFTYIATFGDSITIFEQCVIAVCARVDVGYEISGVVGVRLPAEVKFSGPAEIGEWEAYSLSARLNPLNWTAAQYDAVGIAGEDGNEFVARLGVTFFIEVEVPLLGISRIEDDFEIGNASRSFRTPFGSNTRFPIPGIRNIPFAAVTVFNIITVNFGAGFEFNLTSDKITADWLVNTADNATGQGEIRFQQPNQAVAVGPVLVNDGPPSGVEVELSSFRYWFNRFMIDVFLNVDLDFIGIDVVDLPPIYLLTIDLSDIVDPIGLYVGDHVQCSWNFVCPRVGPDNVLLVTTTVNPNDTAPLLGYALVDTMTLSWQGVTWAQAYQLQLAPTPTFQGATSYDTGANLQFTTPTLPSGRHYWRVRAQRANGSWGGWSRPASFVIQLGS